MKTARMLAILTLAVSFAALPAWAQRPQGAPAAAPAAGGAGKAGKEADLLPAEPVVTQHSAKINGQTIAYAAECGWLPIRDDGKLVAKMFYIYYAKSDVQ